MKCIKIDIRSESLLFTLLMLSISIHSSTPLASALFIDLLLAARPSYLPKSDAGSDALRFGHNKSGMFMKRGRKVSPECHFHKSDRHSEYAHHPIFRVIALGEYVTLSSRFPPSHLSF